MSGDLYVNQTITIPATELTITATRSSGAGGQHVNKTSTRVIIRWSVIQSPSITDEQRALILKKLANRISSDGDLIVDCDTSRSQHANKEEALALLAKLIVKALHKPKKRIATKISHAKKEKILAHKRRRGALKKERRYSYDE